MAVCPACNNEWEPATPLCPQCGYDMSKAQEQAPAGAGLEELAPAEPSYQEQFQPASVPPPVPESGFKLEPPAPGEEIPLPPERPLEMGEYISKAWDMMIKNAGMFILFTVVYFAITAVLGFIPFIGAIASIVITPVLLAGYYIGALKAKREGSVDFGVFFSGFSKILNLFLANLLVGVFVGIPASIAIMPIVFAIIKGSGGAIFVSLIIFILFIIPAIYLGVLYGFALPIIADSELDFWKGMELSRRLITRQWISFFLFGLLLGVINLAGALALGVGILFTAPLTMIAVALAYDHQVNGSL
ncbi:MAG: hypothetical protein M1269_11660 [Chloroflexi bacterium]|nr:hypothetical protein [Chloroflexota bacterium]